MKYLELDYRVVEGWDNYRMSLEEALQAPLGRVNKYVYNGKVYSVKELCSDIGVQHSKFINYKADYGESFMDRLGIGHLGIQPYIF